MNHKKILEIRNMLLYTNDIMRINSINCKKLFPMFAKYLDYNCLIL